MKNVRRIHKGENEDKWKIGVEPITKTTSGKKEKSKNALH